MKTLSPEDGVSIEGPSGPGEKLRVGGSSSPSGRAGGDCRSCRLPRGVRARLGRPAARGAVHGARGPALVRGLPGEPGAAVRGHAVRSLGLRARARHPLVCRTLTGRPDARAARAGLVGADRMPLALRGEGSARTGTVRAPRASPGQAVAADVPSFFVDANDTAVVKVVASEAEAQIVCGLLESAGLECSYRDTEALDSLLEEF